jgi:HEAT repeat protein
MILAPLILFGIVLQPEPLYQGESVGVWVSRLDGKRAREAMTALKFLGRPAVGPLTKALRDPKGSPLIRANAAAVLGDLGVDAAESVPALEESEKDDPDIGVRLYAARSLWKVAGRIEPVLKQIRILSQDANPNARQHVAATAKEMGPAAGPVLRDLLEGARRYPSTQGPPELRSARFKANQQVFEAAVAMGDTSIPELIEALETPAFQLLAQQSLQRFGPKAVRPLTDALEHKSPQVRGRAAIVLGWLKEQGRPAVPDLEKLLGSSNADVRGSAARAIWEISKKADRILPVLLKALRDEDTKGYRGALGLLADIGPLARDAVPDLDRIARSDDADLAALAATALWKIAKDRRVAPLRRALKQRVLLNYHVFWTLAEMGKNAAPATPELLEALTIPGSEFDAEKTLAAIGEPAVGPLIDLLEVHHDSKVRTRAANTLAEIGRAAAPAVPILRRLEALTDPDRSLSAAAHSALKKILGSGAWGTGELTKLLSTSSDRLQRFWAIEELRRLGPEAAPATEVLIKALDDNDSDLRESAADTLVEIGSKAVPQLVQTIRAGSGRAHAHAASALRRIRPRPAEAIPHILDRLERGAADVGDHLAAAVVGIGSADPRAFPAYVKILEQASLSSLREKAAKGLGSFGAKALDPLAKGVDVHRTDPRVLAAIAQSLGKLGKTSAPLIPKLVELLGTDDTQLRKEIIESLTMIGIRPDDVPTVAALLTDKERWIAVPAAQAIGSLGAGAKEAVPALREALKRNDPYLQRAIAEALSAIGPNARDAAPDLLRIVEDPKGDFLMQSSILLVLPDLKPEPKVVLSGLERMWKNPDSRGPGFRQNALLAAYRIVTEDADRIKVLAQALSDPSLAGIATLELNKLGPKAEPAVPELLQALKAGHPDNRMLILATLEKIGLHERMIDTLIEVFSTGPPEFRVRVINDVGALGRKAAKAVPELRRRLRTELEDPTVREASAATLRLVLAGQRADEETSTKLTEALHDRDDRVVAAAATTLAEIVTPAPRPVPRLIELLQSASHDVRASSAYALGRFVLAPDEALPALARVLRDKEKSVASFAVDALVAYGKPSVPHLVEALGDPEAESRRRAAVTLGRVGRPATDAIPALVERLHDADSEVAFEAAGALGQIAPGVAETREWRHILRLDRALSRLAELKGQHGDPDLFERLAVEPVRQAWWQLFWILVGYAAIALAMLGVPALAYLASGRLRRALWRRFNLGWTFVTGRCDHTVVVEPSADPLRVTLTLQTQGLAIVPRFPFDRVVVREPDTSEDFRKLRAHVRSARVRVEVDESEFRRPWARTIGGSLSNGDGAAIAGQLCRISDLVPIERCPRLRLCFAGLGCEKPAGRTGERVPEPLDGVGGEIEEIALRFGRWGAEQLSLQDRPADAATVEHVRKALTSADVVHVSAHAKPDGVYLTNRLLTLNDLDDALLASLRCRLLVLSACELGDLDSPGSLVFPLVRRGVNVIAASRPTGTYIMRHFFLGFYNALLPWRSAEGVELAKAIQRGVMACARRYGSPAPGNTRPWVQTVDSFVLYGDPSFHLRLEPLRASAPIVNGSPEGKR